LHFDGYSGYNKLENIIRCGCLVPLRKKFAEASPTQKVKDNPLTKSEIGRDYCNQLFKLEESISELPFQVKYAKRLELSKPVLEAFWCWLDSLRALQGSSLRKTVIYAKNQNSYMENFLLDGRFSLSNNVMRLKIPFVHLLSEEKTGCFLIVREAPLRV